MIELLIGERYLERLKEPLINYGFTPIALPQNPNIDLRLSGHVDLSIFNAGDIFVLSKYLREKIELVNHLTNKGISIRFAEKEQSPIYPGDAGLCACKVGKWLICNTKSCDPAIVSHFYDNLISVNQGYTRCSDCAIDTNSVITSDRGIAAAAKRNGLNVMLIESGNFELEGFNEGFIGGSSFKFNDTIYFTGVLDRHPDKNRIISFISQRALKMACLTELPAFDIGGAIPF